jgi:hypothetical protein
VLGSDCNVRSLDMVYSYMCDASLKIRCLLVSLSVCDLLICQ